ncbi:HORMA domain-containing protein 1-like [Homalodisca vitripennis]|uniref:HORMA domain-containing protein 1-like n=1 Tax=Homalodisca vitripennis TaxID=197043 RepID=UPI001EECE806|nr:HORMA domain-containing protein 1-like [Homalodisca vitripennis]
MPCSAQSLKNKQKTEVQEFVLENPNISVQKSVDFMKQIVGVAVSTVSYIRNIFPPSAFKTIKISGQKIWLLKGNSDIPATFTLINWIKSAFEAVRENILKKMVFVIQEQDGHETLEVYTFNFSYNFEAISCHILNGNTGQEMTLESKTVPDNIMSAIHLLLRRLIVITENLQPLPNNSELSMRLEFCENVPASYKLPEHFIPVESLSINFPVEAYTIKLGKVESKFTGIALSTKSVLNQDEENKIDSEAEDEVVLPSQELDYNSPFVKASARNCTEESVIEIETRTLSETLSSTCLREKEISCICDCNNESSAVIKCSSCFKFQHKACYKLLNDQEIPHHICVNCHEPDNSEKSCTHPDLVYNENRKFEALYRRALILCLNSVRVSSNTFVSTLNFPRQVAQKILNQLDSDGFLCSPTGKRGNVRTIKIEYLKDKAFTKYFPVHNEESMDEEYTVGPAKRLKYASINRGLCIV